MKKNWGSEIIPKYKWIDPKKQYTCGGKRVVNLRIELYNNVGKEVTYPVKGTVIISEKPWRTKYQIWSLDGRADVVWKKGPNLEMAQKIRNR